MFKVLFVSGSSKSDFEVIPLVKNQGDSLSLINVQVDYFVIKGRGVIGYLSSSLRLRNHIKRNSYDVIHAHYIYSGVVAFLASRHTPIVLSLLGSDVIGKGFFKWTIFRMINIFRFSKIIVKSQDLADRCNFDTTILPNGVDLVRFKPMSKVEARKKLNFKKDETIILFGSCPDRPEKNFKLAQAALVNIGLQENVRFLCGIERELVPVYINAADIVILSSLWEGSPNLIKEAMACNVPVVSTNVGDVSWLFDNCPGCFLSNNIVDDYSAQLIRALEFRSFSQFNDFGRSRIKSLSLDSLSIAQELLAIYKSIINEY